jgi:hypothetical protein
MPETAEEYVIEIEAGIGDPQFLVLPRNTVLSPMSIGRRAMWRVEADDVLDVHAYVYYDGRVLFVQSADEELPVYVNGRAIGCSWTNVAIPCEIAMGRARLRFREQYQELDSLSEQETVAARKPGQDRAFVSRDSERTREHGVHATTLTGRTVRGAPPVPLPPPRDEAPPSSARPPPSARAGDDDPTRRGVPVFPAGLSHVGPGEGPSETAVIARPAVHVAPPAARAAGADVAGVGTGMSTVRFGGANADPGVVPDRQPPGTLHMAQRPKVAARSKMTLRQQWDALSWPKKVAMVVMPLLLVYFLTAPTADENAPSKLTKRDTPDARAAPSGGAAAGLTPSAASTVPTLPVSALPIAPALTAPAPSLATSTASPAPTQKSLERQAVDLFASGQYERAAFAYDQLARQYPDNPAYREAARILRSKLDGGTPTAP